MTAPPPAPDKGRATPATDMFATVLAARERYREAYLQRRDPIAEDRMLWRAQTFRHLVHLLPGQSILELGCGRGLFTRRLAEVSRGENPITAVTFLPEAEAEATFPPAVTRVTARSLPGPLEGQRFDFIVAHDLLDQRDCASLLQHAHALLKPGGEVVFYESNPWNAVLKARRAAGRLLGRKDPRSLLSRPRLYEVMSEVGFVRVFAVYNDFVYAPLTRPLAWLLRNASIVLENMPGVRTLAGSILVHAQKPPRRTEQEPRSLCEHDTLRDAVSVVVPCHNEEMNVGPLVQRLRALYDDYLHEIILVDDNSTDRTREVIQELAAADERVKPVVRRPPNGVGRALADGYRAATGRWVLSMDSDFVHLLPEMRDLFDAAAQGYDVVIGSRFLPAQRAAELPDSEDHREPGVPRPRPARAGAPLPGCHEQPEADPPRGAGRDGVARAGVRRECGDGLGAAHDGVPGKGGSRSRGSTGRLTWGPRRSGSCRWEAGTTACWPASSASAFSETVHLRWNSMDSPDALGPHAADPPDSQAVDWLVANRRMLFIALVWGVMVAAALFCIARYGHDIPLAEDWHLVAPYTGNEPDVAGWLWAQNNEHRVPLPRLVYLALLGLAGGDFRAGMVYNVLVLALLSAALMAAARRLRGGRSRYADAFFPLLFLHLGHWPNLIWGWQLQFVTAVALTVGLLLVLLSSRPLSPRAALTAGVCLMLLPLCGANGILYVWVLAPWFVYEGVVLARSEGSSSPLRRVGWGLVTMAVLALGVTGAYFIGYERATWNPPPPDIGAALATSARYVAMGFGPAAQWRWTAAVLGTAAVLLPTLFVLARSAARLRGLEQRRALGLVAFAVACAGLALAMGWGRAGLVPEVGMPARYALLSAPTLAATYFVWELYGPVRLRSGIALLLLIVTAALVPLNTRIGFGWRNWYVGGMDAVERDLQADVPLGVMAERHRAFLLHWDQAKLEAGMRMLRAAGLGPFGPSRALPSEQAAPPEPLIADPEVR